MPCRTWTWTCGKANVALAGHNGAGKSTLIKLILGLIRPSAGRVALFGHDAHSPRAQLRARVGYLPETVALHPSMTGAETLAFYARLKRQPLSANAALLERSASPPPAAGASAAIPGHAPAPGAGAGAAGRAALLLDEPTTGLDPASRQLFYRIVAELRAAGATILLSTHALSELAGHADRVVVMKAGRKIADGTLSELRRRTGLPLRIRLTLAGPGSGSGSGSGSGAPLPPPWRALDSGRYERLCAEDEKVAAIRAIGAIGQDIRDLDIDVPGLDEIYAHLLEREDI